MLVWVRTRDEGPFTPVSDGACHRQVAVDAIHTHACSRSQRHHEIASTQPHMEGGREGGTHRPTDSQCSAMVCVGALCVVPSMGLPSCSSSPYHRTVPPSFFTRSSSDGRFGLWSCHTHTTPDNGNGTDVRNSPLPFPPSPHSTLPSL